MSGGHSSQSKIVVTRTFVVDLLCVVTFVAIGRRTHDSDRGWFGLIKVSLPFVLALTASWHFLKVSRAPLGNLAFLKVWVGTVGLGMLLRHFVFRSSTATSFIIVASIFLGVAFFLTRAAARQSSPGAK